MRLAAPPVDEMAIWGGLSRLSRYFRDIHFLKGKNHVWKIQWFFGFDDGRDIVLVGRTREGESSGQQ